MMLVTILKPLAKLSISIVTSLMLTLPWSNCVLAEEIETKGDEINSYQSSLDAISGPCYVPVTLSDSAERRAGGALYERHNLGVLSTAPAHMVSPSGKGERMQPHMLHKMQFGGKSFFMAPNKLHHLEPIYSDVCGFQLVIYNAFTQPISVNRFRAFIRINPVRQDDQELIRFLTPAQDGALLHTVLGKRMPRPFEIELYVKFPGSDDPELFNIIIPGSDS